MRRRPSRYQARKAREEMIVFVMEICAIVACMPLAAGVGYVLAHMSGIR